MSRGHRITAAIVAAVIGALALALPAAAGSGERPGGGNGKHCLDPKRVAAASHYADKRAGQVSFAVLDECGRLLGDHRYRAHLSASVVKVMLMTAYLRRHGVRHDSLTESERRMLGPMIRRSNNHCANEVYGIVGAEGLYDVARDAHMRHFTTQPVWGASEITAGDQARFIGHLEKYLPRRHRAYALGLMARVIQRQRWGIPRLKLPGWKVRIKGGWSPQVGGGWRVNQVARIEDDGRQLSLAILTANDPDFGYGRATIEGVGKRLLKAYEGG